jgi:aspartokinase/homoserine dehydrogenase 1
MTILKFGGSSVGSSDAIKQVFSIVTGKAGSVRVVVVSAFSGVTDALIDAARKAAAGDGGYRDGVEVLRKRHLDAAADLLGPDAGTLVPYIAGVFDELSRILDGIEAIRELPPRTLDLVMSAGERLSAKMIAAYFCARGVEAEYLDSRLVVKTDAAYGKARYLPSETETAAEAYFGRHSALQIAAGFIGEAADGSTTTLGRGGSDFTAAILGAALNADSVEIWTDVDGILSADPRLVKNAFRMDEISYTEALELSHFGAKVIYPPTVRPALEKNIPIWIGNTFNPGSKGTWIQKNAASSSYPIRGLSSLSNVSLLRLQGGGMAGVAGFAARLFSALARKSISVILITQGSSEYSICVAISPVEVYSAVAAVMEEFDREIASGTLEQPSIENACSIIAAVGSRMKSTPGISGTVFHALGRNGINIKAIAQGSSETNISAVIAKQDETKALNAVHEAFFLSGTKSVNLFLIGIGLIGGTLLEQISAQREILKDRYKIRVNLIGIANSKRMIFDAQGMDPENARSLLESKDSVDASGMVESFAVNGFVARMKALNLPNACFCDCTANDAVASVYASVLESAIPIVTPNKRANSGDYAYYKKITDYSRDRGIPYLYEVTVCAGLPIISTLRDLHLAGDKVTRIEAVLSGTLSYIFNNFDGSKPFSALVREGKAKGYTEPDPRDDLNAKDAARKALILSRECGEKLEFSAIDIEPILPERCLKAPDTDAFFTELEKCDADFEKRRAAAAKKGAALRYVAVIEKGRASLQMREEPEGSPFRSLVDADNIVVITTDRYRTLPMVIKGPGAGAAVTAGAVFADIVRTARTLV